MSESDQDDPVTQKVPKSPAVQAQTELKAVRRLLADDKPDLAMAGVRAQYATALALLSLADALRERS